MAVATSRDARTGLPDWAWGILVMVGIVLLSRLSDIASFTGLPIKPWKPGAGFAFGMLLVRGLHLLPWVLLGQASAVLAASLAADLPPDWGASIAAGFSASLGLGMLAKLLEPQTGSKAKVTKAEADDWQGVDRDLFERLRRWRRRFHPGEADSPPPSDPPDHS